ncbi:MAG: hypothetical protein AAF547_17785 [Actinomycetota bacterium]
MTTKTSKRNSQRSHDRSALIQWTALGLVVALGLFAILVLTDANTYGGHGGFLALL